jgi:hypothetical protein
LRGTVNTSPCIKILPESTCSRDLHSPPGVAIVIFRLAVGEARLRFVEFPGVAACGIIVEVVIAKR